MINLINLFVFNEEANKLNRDSKVNSHRIIDSTDEITLLKYKHYLCFSVTVRTNKFALKKNEKYLSELIKSINK